jgi:hypothetical protein
MNSFIQRHRDVVIGQLNGFDRVRFRGTKRFLATVGGMFNFLFRIKVLLKDFKGYAMSVTEQIRQASVQVAQAADRPVIYLAGGSDRKEDLARRIIQRDRLTEGLVCMLTSVEPCRSYRVRGNGTTKKLELLGEPMKCLHHYHYYLHRQLGLLNVRLQTWFPFTIHVCINGREWLARQMDRAGLGYRRKENCFVAIDDLEGAQQLLDQQLQADWPGLLDELAGRINPAAPNVFQACPVPYYWSVQESEWASDLLCKSPAALARLYPRLIRHGITTLASGDVMRFLGYRVPADGHVHRRFSGQVVSDLGDRPEGVRIKHRLNTASIKMYDKQGSVLRVETTVNNPRDIKVYRAKEGQPTGPKAWRRLRKGVADVHRRAQVCQSANDRYLEAMAAAQTDASLAELAGPVCRRTTCNGQSVRGLNPLADDDARLLAAVARGEFTLHGFRNRDLQSLLYDRPPCAPAERRRRSGVVTRKLRMLRAHGLIRKVSGTYRYLLTTKGRETVAALLSARQANTAKLLDAA